MHHNPIAAAVRQPLRAVLVFSLAINISILAPSIFMLQVFDRVLTTRSVETLLLMAAIATATLLLMGWLEYLRARSLAAIGVLVEQEQGEPLLRRLLGGPAGGAAPEALRDLSVVRAFLGGPGVLALCDAPWTAVYLALIFLFHPAMGWLATGCTLALLALALVNERMTRQRVVDLGDALRQTGRVADVALRQAEVVTALGMRPALARRWSARSAMAHRLQLGLAQKSALFSAATRLARQFVQVLMLGYGAYLVIQEHATPGIMLAATIILARALAPIEQLMGGWKQLVEARAAYGRLAKLLAQPERAPRTPLPRPRGRLVLENLGVNAPGSQRALLQGVSLQLEAGQVLAVIGASGSGKTTLVRALVGAVQPDAGTVRVDGADLDHWDADDRGRWLGYLPQDVVLFEGSIAENIARHGEAEGADVLAAARLAGVHDMLLRLPEGYDTAVGEGGQRLSGGQRQRVALARALYGQPALVVMDEPDSSLDGEGEKALVEALRELKQQGTTVVVVTQRRGVLAAADLIAVMNEGRLERLAPVQPAVPQALPARAVPASAA